MTFNVLIQIGKKEQMLTDCFYYNAEKHYLNYHVPYQDNESWEHVPNVDCEITVVKPFMYVRAKATEE